MNVLLWATVLYMGGFHLSPMTRQMCQIKPHCSLFYWGNTPAAADSQTHAVVHFHWCSLSPRFTRVHDSVYFVSSQLAEGGLNRLHHIIHRLTFAVLISPLRYWSSRASPACWSPPFSFPPGCFCQGGEPPCSRYPCSSSGTTVAHTLASYWATLTTPSPAGYYVNKPRIPSLPLSLPPSHPAAAGRPGSHWIPILMKCVCVLHPYIIIAYIHTYYFIQFICLMTGLKAKYQ